MKQHQIDYEKIYEHLKKLTNNFSEAEITPHHTAAQVLLDLCRVERKWEFLMEEGRKNLTKNRLIQDLRATKQYLKGCSPLIVGVFIFIPSYLLPPMQ